MRKQLITVPNQILRTKSAEFDFSKEKKQIEKLILDLTETLNKKEDPKGVGLSAPQIGVNYRAFATLLPEQQNLDPREQEDEEEQLKLELYLNPVIEKYSGALSFGPDPEEPTLEGCLSIPHLYGPVPRYTEITLTYFNEQFQEKRKVLSGFAARVVQHEFDHLEGVLFTDYILKYDLPLYEMQKKKLIEIDSSIARAF